MQNTFTNILFLCTGNACRSQIAEGYARHFGEGMIHVQSAGIEAHGKNPWAIQVMHEDGIDISSQQSTRLNSEMLAWADLIVTVCSSADMQCPLLPKTAEKRHWPFDDPAQTIGSNEKIKAKFLEVRDQIRQRVKCLVEEIIDYEDGI